MIILPTLDQLKHYAQTVPFTIGWDALNDSGPGSAELMRSMIAEAMEALPDLEARYQKAWDEYSNRLSPTVEMLAELEDVGEQLISAYRLQDVQHRLEATESLMKGI